jgi:hypothetical protein
MGDGVLAGERARRQAGLDRFVPLELLGAGSLGRVFRARDETSGSELALKTLDALKPEALYRLKHEFRTLATIRHPSLVRLHELVVDDDDCFFTMELVDGTDFVSFVRDGTPSGTLTPEVIGRLVASAAQLAGALAAVHRAGRLHRDVKPANVRVTPHGRVVLLDFDLALDLDTTRVHSDDSCTGTFAYMAPEQAFGGELGPAADWYAFGSLLYEALTGRLPFEGSIRAVLVEKAQHRPPPTRTHAPAVPAPLDELVSALLHPKPGRRPEFVDIRRTLIQLGASMGDVAAGAPPAPFVGRVRESITIEDALEPCGDRMSVVHVHGPSGIGKSELVRRVLRAVERRHDALVLRGRCHDRESVPYKAFDTIVDGIAAVVGRLSDDEQTRVLPSDVGALVRLFPVLGRVPAMAGSRDAVGDVEPAEIRRRAFDALRTLLGRLAHARRLVLWIDDLQWADVDSGALLEALARPPDAPSLALVLSYRTQDRARVPLLATLRAMPDAPAAVRETEVVVEPLSADETAELARAMASPGTVGVVARVAEEAAGSPFFVGEIMRYLAREGTVDGDRPLTLDDAMRERVGRLNAAGRALLEVAALAGGPIDATVALDAAGWPGQRATMHALEDEALVCSTALSDRVVLEVYHDRLRELVASMVPADDRPRRHHEIAAALQRSPSPDPQDLFAHFLGAGDRDQARHWAMVAGDAAAETLAFHRAAGLYHQALELGGQDDRALRLRHAEALVNAGLGSDAAPEFERLAELGEQEGAPVVDVTALRRRAGEQYLQNGHLVEGTALMRRVLAASGVDLPKTVVGAVARLVTEWLRMQVHRRGFAVLDPSVIPASALQRLEAYAVAWSSFSVVDPLVSAVMGARAAREGMAHGHRPAIIRGLVSLASHQAAVGGRSGRRRSHAHLARLQPIAAASRDPYDHALADTAAGVVAFCEAHWRTAHDRCRRAAEHLRSARGVAFEISLVESFALTSLAYLGRLADLARELPRAIAEADDRGNRVASVGLRLGMPALVWLAEDRPEFALELGDAWIAKWPRTRFFVQHYLHLVSSAHIDLYRGDARSAWTRLEHAWPDVRRSGILLHKLHHAELRFLRANAAMALAMSGGSREWPAKRLVAVATRDARWIARARDVATSAPYAAMIRMAIARHEGRTEPALAFGEHALRACDVAEMALHRAAVQRALGVIRGGDHGAALVTAADARLVAEDVQRPALLAGMLVPGNA